MITPALSVLSAVEGLKLVTRSCRDYIVPISVAILVAALRRAIARHGGGVEFFGPITALWFLVLAVAGIAIFPMTTASSPRSTPITPFSSCYTQGLYGVVVLGAVFLTVTGAEALYADLGHFGRKPIRRAWFALVFPALTLNYLGQGALVLRQSRRRCPIRST